MEYKLISIDLAKTVFQVAAFNPDNTIAFNRKVSRSALLDTLRQCAPTLVVMECCNGIDACPNFPAIFSF